MYNYYVAQVFGIIAILIVGYSYQQKKKNKYLILQLMANVCFILQFLFLDAYSGMYSSLISLVRTICFYFDEKKNNKIHLSYLLIFQVLIIICGILTYETILSIIPIIIASTYGIGMYVKDLRVTYSITTVNTIGWIFYNFTVKAHANFVGNIIELLFSIIGLIRMIKYKNKV